MTQNYLTAALFIVRSHQFSNPDECWYIHEDSSEYCRMLKTALEWGKKCNIISRFYLSTRGAAIFWKPDEHDKKNIEVQCQLTEPYGQVLCHFNNDKDFKSPEVWKKVRLVNSNNKAQKGYVKYFNYQTKTFMFEPKLARPNIRPVAIRQTQNPRNLRPPKNGKSSKNSK